MKRIKKFVALALAASMVFATASTAFAAKSAQTITEPNIITSVEKLRIPMYKEDGKWKIDPLFAYIGIKNIKWNSKITDMSIKGYLGGKAGDKKLGVNTTWKYAPYALLLNQKGTIVPHSDALKTPDIIVTFWVKGDRQRFLYTRHSIRLHFVKRKTPFVMFKIGNKDLLADSNGELFAETNSEKFYKLQKDAWRTIKVKLKPYYNKLKLVAVRKDGRNEVIRSTSGRYVVCSYNLKELKSIQIRYSIKRDSDAWRNCLYYNYLKDGVELPNTVENLVLNIK